MIQTDKLIQSVIASFWLLTSTASMAENTTPPTEKCYGIVKTGMNDCATANASCAGSALKDNQKDAFLFMPKGMCEKITGASLSPEK